MPILNSNSLLLLYATAAMVILSKCSSVSDRENHKLQVNMTQQNTILVSETNKYICEIRNLQLSHSLQIFIETLLSGLLALISGTAERMLLLFA